MKKGKRTDGKRKTVTARKKPAVQQSTTEPRTSPRTYEIMQIDSDQELGMVRMTAREIFEENCPGEKPETFDELNEAEVHTRMHEQASRLTVFEDKWHPEDVTKVADACTDYIMDFRELKKLDTEQLNRVRMPATPITRPR